MQRTCNPVLSESTKKSYSFVWLSMMYCCSAFRERASCEMGFSWRNIQQFTVREIGQPDQPERRRYWLLKLSLPLPLLYYFVTNHPFYTSVSMGGFVLAAAAENLLDIDDYSSAVENVDNSTEPNNNNTTLWVRSCPLMNAFSRIPHEWLLTIIFTCRLKIHSKFIPPFCFSFQEMDDGLEEAFSRYEAHRAFLISSFKLLSHLNLFSISLQWGIGRTNPWSELHVKSMLITFTHQNKLPTTILFLKIVWKVLVCST